MADVRRILVFATKGAGSNDETRILELLHGLDVDRFPFDRGHKLTNIPGILRRVRRTRPALVVMEGTGVAGGLAVLAARALFRVPFVVSSGDAVGPFLAGSHPSIAVPAHVYERLLYRCGAGFIGWTPYLVGRAISLGARRAMTAASWSQRPELAMQADEVRKLLGVQPSTVLIGIVGSLDWNANKGYCYGLELVRAIKQTQRRDVAIAVVGGGTGLARLRELAGDELGKRIFVPGPIDQELVTSYLAAMDVGSLPQTLDAVGALRYTTKLSEYITAGLPIITGRLPLAYDLAQEWSWRLPGSSPWSDEYVNALAHFMQRITSDEISQFRSRMPVSDPAFDKLPQQRRVAAFVSEIAADVA